MSVRIAGAGCCLMDELYPEADFGSAAFSSLRSRADGDGGLSPGRLVFAADVERFAASRGDRRPFAEMLADLTGGAKPAAENVGGPSVVALIHAAQMLEGESASVEFRGQRGDDALGERLVALLRRTPLGIGGYRTGPGPTPSTFVLSDPRWDGGRGERCFINEIGAAGGFRGGDLDDGFLSADILALGGTALVPGLHDGLPEVLGRAKGLGVLTVVNTVFDFRSESADPVGSWPLGPRAKAGSIAQRSDFGPRLDSPGPRESYERCDLLIADRDEALRLSGERELEPALGFLERSGAGAYLVTRGGDEVLAWASPAGRFAPLARSSLPVSSLAGERLREEFSAGSRSGDTTGCGDAFAGGVLASLATQLAAAGPGSRAAGRGAAERGSGPLDLVEAAGWGIAGGAATLFVLGGTYYESRPGEKRAMVERFHEAWLEQTKAGKARSWAMAR
jgi:sugar/nucleoside kinase (ribokinase family)